MRLLAPSLACAALVAATPLAAQTAGNRCFDTDDAGNPTPDTAAFPVGRHINQIGRTLAGQPSRLWGDGEVLLVYGDTLINGGCRAVSTKLWHWSPFDLVPGVVQLDSIPRYKAVTLDSFVVGDQRRIVHAPPVLDPATLRLTGSNYAVVAPETYHVNLRVEPSFLGDEYVAMVMYYDAVPGAPGEDVTIVERNPESGKAAFGMGSSLAHYGDLGLAPGAAWNNHLLAAASAMGAPLDMIRIQPADAAPPIVRTFTAGPQSFRAQGVVPVILRDWHKDAQYRPDTLRSYEQRLAWSTTIDSDIWSNGVAALSFNIDNVGIDTLRTWVSDHRQTATLDSVTLTAMGLRGFQRRVVLGGVIQNPRAVYSRTVTFTPTAQGTAAADPPTLWATTPRWRLGNDVLLARVRPLGLRDVRFVTWDSRQLSDSLRIVLDSRGLRVNLLAFTTQDPTGTPRSRRYGTAACDSGGCGGLDGWTFNALYSQLPPLPGATPARFPQVVAGPAGVDFEVAASLAPRDAAHAGDITWSFGGTGKFGLVTATGASARLEGGEHPDLNSGWGLTFLRAQVRLDDTLTLVESRPASLFFARDARVKRMSLLGEKVPNWFYYWLQAARTEAYLAEGGFPVEWSDDRVLNGLWEDSWMNRATGSITLFDALRLTSFKGPPPQYTGQMPPPGAQYFELYTRCNRPTLNASGVSLATRNELIRSSQAAAALSHGWMDAKGYCYMPQGTWEVSSGIDKFAGVLAHETAHGLFYSDTFEWARLNGCSAFPFSMCGVWAPWDLGLFRQADYAMHYLWRSPTGQLANCGALFDAAGEEIDLAVLRTCSREMRRIDEFQADMRRYLMPPDVLTRLHRLDWAYPGHQYVP